MRSTWAGVNASACGVQASAPSAATDVTALNTAALTAFTTAAPHRSKRRIPPGPAAREAAALLRGEQSAPTRPTGSIIDLTQYAEAAARRRTLPTDPTPVAKEQQ